MLEAVDCTDQGAKYSFLATLGRRMLVTVIGLKAENTPKHQNRKWLRRRTY
jgi:hypothetical protein